MLKTQNPIDTHVGRRVRTQRLVLGLSQEKLADALGVTFQQVQKYENGSNRISASRLHMIAAKMGVEPSFFFDGAPADGVPMAAATDGYTATDVSALMATSEGVALAKAFQAITSPNVRRRVIDLVEAIAPVDVCSP